MQIRKRRIIHSNDIAIEMRAMCKGQRRLLNVVVMQDFSEGITLRFQANTSKGSSSKG